MHDTRRRHGIVFASGVSASLVVLLGVFALQPALADPAIPPDTRSEITMPDTILPALVAADVFTVTISASGARQESYPDKAPCLYGEAVYGDEGPDGWASWQMISSGTGPVTVETPQGPVTLPLNRMLLHLTPSYHRVFTPAEAELAPEMMRSELGDGSVPLTVAAYTLVPGKTYHAKVERQTLLLPPAPGTTKPQKRIHHLLAISDLPFQAGKPVPRLTPGSFTAHHR